MTTEYIQAVPEIHGVPRYTPEAWPRWESALFVLQMQARFAAATLPGNPFGAELATKTDAAGLRTAFAEYDAECKYISRMLLSGYLGDYTIQTLTPEMLRFAWMAGGMHAAEAMQAIDRG